MSTHSLTTRVNCFIQWSHHPQTAIETVTNLAQAIQWNELLRGKQRFPRSSELVNRVLAILPQNPSTYEQDQEASIIISQLRKLGYCDDDFKMLLKIPAKLSRFVKTAPLFVADYETNNYEMKYVIKFTNYTEFLAQRVYYVFLTHCIEMQQANMHVCRTSAIIDPFGQTPRYDIDDSESSQILDKELLVNCNRELEELLGDARFTNWKKFTLPTLLISEKVEGDTLREFILDGEFENLNLKQKQDLCIQLGMSATLDFVFGNHDRMIHNQCSNLGNIMLTIDDEGTLHCWLIDNGDVPPTFGEDLTIQTETLSDPVIFQEVAMSLEGLRPEYPKGVKSRKQNDPLELESQRFSSFVDFMQTSDMQQHLRMGIVNMRKILISQCSEPGLNERLRQISAHRLSVSDHPAPVFQAKGKYIPPHKKRQ